MRSDFVTIQWQLYGVIVRRRGDNLVIEPLTDLILSEGFEFRITRPLGGDRVSHVANGHILTACRSVPQAACHLNCSPVINDLVYLEIP